MSDSDLIDAVARKTGEDSHGIPHRDFTLTGPGDAGPEPKRLLDVLLVDLDARGTVDCETVHQRRRLHRRPRLSRQKPTERVKGVAVRFTHADTGLWSLTMYGPSTRISHSTPAAHAFGTKIPSQW